MLEFNNAYYSNTGNKKDSKSVTMDAESKMLVNRSLK